MWEKLILAATVTVVIHFLLPIKSANITHTGWEVLSETKTSTEVVNLLDQQPSIKVGNSNFSQR
jgi:hypothetical protein